LAVPDGPVAAAIDPLRTVQVLTNLIGNALKYSAPGTSVEVHLHVDHVHAHVDVLDRGRGIPADQLERVFEKFHRVEDPLRMTTSGTGLGLYIAKQLATAMGGTLACTSTLGVGSTFRFSVPLALTDSLTDSLTRVVDDRRPPMPRLPEDARKAPPHPPSTVSGAGR
jgi:signal transduction histidine kinase